MINDTEIPQGLWTVQMFHRRYGANPYFFTNKFYWMGWWMSAQAQTFAKLGIKHNRWGIFSFFDRDYVPQQQTSLWNELVSQASIHWPAREVKDIYILTSPRILGYAFNPISFFFISFGPGQLECLIQVCNTYREIFHYPSQGRSAEGFNFKLNKNLYVSPFLTLQSQFHFQLTVPTTDQPFKVSVETLEIPSGHRLLKAALTGRYHHLTYFSLRWMSLRFPLHPLMAIILIHWHAFKLWMSGVPYFKKQDHLNDQKGVKTWKAS